MQLATRAGKLKRATRSASMGEPSLVIPGGMAATVHVPSGNEEPAVNKVIDFLLL